jgi:hypothetical protein
MIVKADFIFNDITVTTLKPRKKRMPPARQRGAFYMARAAFLAILF